MFPSVIEPFIDKIIEWVKTSEGLVRADVVHRKLVAMQFPGLIARPAERSLS